VFLVFAAALLTCCEVEAMLGGFSIKIAAALLLLYCCFTSALLTCSEVEAILGGSRICCCFTAALLLLH
jgi:hypothetical protein